MSVRPEAWPELAYLPLLDAEPCTLAIVRRAAAPVLGRRPELTAGGLSAREVDD
jgi:hypothetical protein